MKNLITFIVLVLLFSCTKDDPDPVFCWQCTYDHKAYTREKEVCNFTEANIRQLEKDASHIMPGDTVIVTCVKE